MSTKTFTRAALSYDYNTLEQTNSAGSPLPVQSSKNILSVANFGIRVGVNNPKWRSQVEKRENASTDFSASSTLSSFRACRYRIKSKVTSTSSKATFDHYGRVTPASMPSAPAMLSTFEADNQARTHFFKNAVKSQRFLQSGVFIGELRETLSLLRNPAKGLRTLVSILEKDAKLAYKLPKGKRKSVPLSTRVNQVKQAIADSWLEFSFGWSPLVGDLEAASGLLANLALRANDNFVRVEGFGIQEDHTMVTDTLIDATIPLQTGARPFAVRQQTRTDRETMVRYYGMIKLDLPDPSNSRLLTGLGLTLNDAAPTVWELIPWSFFVDYFSNIGDIIEAWSYPRAKIAWVSRVERKIRKQACFWAYNPARTAQQYAGNSYIITSANVRDGHQISTTKEILRTASVEIAVPTLSIQLPSLTRQFLNIGALVSASFRRPRGGF